MIRLDTTARNANYHTTVAACDKCGEACAESLEYGTGHWEAAMATAGAKNHGWTVCLVGRYQRIFCPKCVKLQKEAK